MDVYRTLHIKNPSYLLHVEKATVHFPIFKFSPLPAARVTFYKDVLDIMNQVKFIPKLYYAFTSYLQQGALAELCGINQPRQTETDCSKVNFVQDVDTFICFICLHGLRDTSELLQDQLNYVNNIFKAHHTKPTAYKNQCRTQPIIVLNPSTMQS